MKNINKYNKYLYLALRIVIGLDIIYRCRSNTINLLVFLGLFIVIVINDYLREKYFYKSIRRYYTSVFLSMIISLILAINLGGYVEAYFFMILYELILFTQGKISKLFVMLDILIYLTLIIFRIIAIEEIGTIEFWQENILDIIMIPMGILFYSLSLLGYKILRKEKREVDRLNKELELSYNKLKEQSEKIEELTITKERNRLAGEIHDNLGHSLIALNMNLDVVEKIIDKDIIKAKELVSKSQILTKESMESLRKAVYALKEEGSNTLRNSIEKIVDNIESTGKVKVSLNIDERVEELLPEYKDIIFTSIKESLTNSMKHGKADTVNIDIKLDEEKLIVSARDNGLGCSNLIKGNGLIGIEDRISKYGGSVNYSSKENKGFSIELILPSVNVFELSN